MHKAKYQITTWIVPITEQMRQKAREVAMVRAANKHGVLASSRPLSEGYEEIGALGEIGLGKKLYQSVDIEQRMDGDLGKDLRFRDRDIDVKTARKAYNLLVEHGKVASDIYVLCQYYFDKLEFLGWALKEEVTRAPMKDFGYGILNHYIPRNKLYPMDSLFKLNIGKQQRLI